jgi:hypothetical protein
MVGTSDLKVPDLAKLREKEQHKAMQVLLYGYCYTKSKKYKFNKPLEAGIYSFKNLNSGFLPVNFSSNYRKPDVAITEEKLEEFMSEIKTYIKEMYALDVDFIEPADLKY